MACKNCEKLTDKLIAANERNAKLGKALNKILIHAQHGALPITSQCFSRIRPKFVRDVASNALAAAKEDGDA